MAELIERVVCRTPGKGRAGVTNIPAWKFDTGRDAILSVYTAKFEVEVRGEIERLDAKGPQRIRAV